MDKRQIKYGLAAFIDILGFSEKVAKVETEDDLTKIEKTIGYVQQEFEYRPKDKLRKASHKIISKSVLAFTDCLVVFVPGKSQGTQSQGSFDVLMQELDSFGLSQGSCVLNGYVLRGGVAIGFWYKSKDTLISSAQVAAYKMESKHVVVPMIGVDAELYTLLADHPGRKFYSEDIEPLKRVLVEYPNPETGKPMWLINYLRICLDSAEPSLTSAERTEYKTADPDRRDAIMNGGYFRGCSELATQHKLVIEAALTNETEERVNAKYRWLAEYHNTTIRAFFHVCPEELLINTAWTV